MSLLSRLAPQRAVLLRATASAASSSQPPSSPLSTSATSDTNHILKLPDGRTLGYALYGHPTGTPAFFFHGSPSCRLEGVDWHKAALNQGVRIIGVDRWGMGLSSFTPKVKLSDWPTDIQALATHLQLPRFHVFGGSGGGPYALACAAKLPKEVLLGTGVVAGVAPPEAGTKGMSWDRWVAFKLNIWLPSRVIKWMMDTALGNAARCGDDAAFAKQMDKLIATFSVEEQEVLRKDPEFKKNFAESFCEACRAGCDGAVLDNKLILLPWDFQMRDVSGEVRIWNGTADVHVPVHAARWMAERLPNARLKEYEGESHLSLPLNYGEEILADLMAMGRGVDE